MVDKGSSFSSILSHYGLLVMVVRTILLPQSPVLLKINVLSGGKWMVYSVIFSSNPLSPKPLITLGTIKWFTLYSKDIQRLYRVISSIDSLEQPGMELSSFIGQMAALKIEFSSILSKSINTKSSQSKIDKVFTILTLIKHGAEFESIRK